MNCDGELPECAPPWSVAFTPTGSFTPMFMDVDGQGNVYLAGALNGSVDLGGGTLTSVAEPDIVIAKFNRLGDHQWSKSFGDPGTYLIFTGMDVAPSGAIALAGIFYESIDLGGPTLLASPSGGFTAVLDSSGAHVWSTAIQGNLNGASTVAMDDTGRVLVAVHHGGPITIDNTVVGDANGSSLLRLTADGMFDAGRSFGCVPQGMSVLALPNHNVLFGGRSPGNGCDLGGGPIEMSAGFAFARFDEELEHVVTRAFASVNVTPPVTYAADSTGSIGFVGNTAGPVNFDGLIVDSGTTVLNGFAATLHPDGSFDGATYVDASDPYLSVSAMRSARFDVSGNLVGVGSMHADLDLSIPPLQRIGARDVLVVQMAPGGQIVSARNFGGLDTTSDGIVVAHDGSAVIIAGTYVGSTEGALAPDFGDGALLPGGTQPRVFLARIAL